MTPIERKHIFRHPFYQCKKSLIIKMFEKYWPEWNMETMQGKSRITPVVAMRHAYCVCLYMYTNYSDEAIGISINKDRSTIHSSLDSAENAMSTLSYPEFLEPFRELQMQLENKIASQNKPYDGRDNAQSLAKEITYLINMEDDPKVLSKDIAKFIKKNFYRKSVYNFRKLDIVVKE